MAVSTIQITLVGDLGGMCFPDGIPLAQGSVLEIGVGPGVNFRHYDPARVSMVYALEPTSTQKN
jgi:hypothetical protein